MIKIENLHEVLAQLPDNKWYTMQIHIRRSECGHLEVVVERNMSPSRKVPGVVLHPKDGDAIGCFIENQIAKMG